MAEELIGDQNDSQIFLRALRDYSESCEPPNLKQDCPFAIDISPGLRGCGEECMDLLGRFGAPPPLDNVLGANGITIHLREDRRHIRDLDLIKLKKLCYSSNPKDSEQLNSMCIQYANNYYTNNKYKHN